MKKKATVLTAGTLTLALALTGCSTGSSPKTAATGSEKPAATSSAAPVKKEIKYIAPYNPATDTFKDGLNINNNPIIKYHREKSGIDVQIEVLPRENPSQKISLILASGDVPDWIPFGSKEDYFKLAKQGAFLQLDELIKKAPNYQKLVTPEQLDAARVDGKLYAFVYPQTATVARGVLIRSDLLQELNLKQPNTLDEYVQVFKTIKEKKGITPLTAASSGEDFDSSLSAFAGAFGVGTTTVVKNGKLEFSYVQPEYKEYLTFLKMLFDEGLLDKEFPVLKTNNLTEKMIAGKAAAAVISWWDAKTITDTLATKIPNAKVDYQNLPVGPKGLSGMIQEVPIARYSVIPKGAKNAEAMVEYLNYISSPDALKVQDFGFEGTNYKMENGKPVQTIAQSNEIGWRIMYQLMDTKENFSNRLVSKGFTPYYNSLVDDKQVKEETFFAPPIDGYDKKLSELRTFKNENVVKFIVGNRDLKEFDKFVEEFNARGGKTAIDAMNNEYFTKKK
ncbi:extracellular solute-binding protein [Paenibacillus sp. MBLB4367]|uniref:extracellular solute-binding protein n=1 Tax=Paenibacillus sp. MBLB4367 TaxID=3384767 RepID=UPI0039080964